MPKVYKLFLAIEFMGFGSLIRFALGILLSLEVLRSWFFGGEISVLAVILSVVFLILAAAWAIFRF